MPHHHDPHKKHPSLKEHRQSDSSDVETSGASRFEKNLKSPSPQSLLEKIRTMFSWIANRITQEAQESEPVESGDPESNRLLSLYATPNLVQQAKESISRLEASKQALLEEFGHVAQAFVDRYIDPVFAPIKTMIRDKNEGKAPVIPKDAVESVEILAMAHDPSRLKRKIRDSIKHKTRDVLLEDIAFLLSYPSEAIGDASIPSDQRGPLLRQIEIDLQPILLELESMLSIHPPSTEFSALFEWKIDVDAKRQILHDESMRIIESEIHRNIPYWKSLEDDLGNQEDPFLDELEIFTEGSLHWPLSIYELEDASARLREALEKELVGLQNERVVIFFDRMKSHVKTLQESEESEGHEEALTRIFDHVKAIDRLLGLDE